MEGHLCGRILKFLPHRTGAAGKAAAIAAFRPVRTVDMAGAGEIVEAAARESPDRTGREAGPAGAGVARVIGRFPCRQIEILGK